MNKDGITINELSKMAQVTVRTIRFYTDEGVLDEPAGRDRYARYTRKHYLQLNAARTLKERYLPLRVIRDQMASLNESDLERLAGPTPALIEARFKEAEGFGQYDAVLFSAPQRFSNVESLSEEALLFAPLLADLSEEIAQEKEISMLKNVMQERILFPKIAAPMHRGVVRQKESVGAAQPIGEAWHRIVISPSMELHVREDGMQEAGEIRRILASLRKR